MSQQNTYLILKTKFTLYKALINGTIIKYYP